MNGSAIIPVRAVVDVNERTAVELAASLLQNTLGAAAGGPVRVRCQFEPSLDALKEADGACIIIASLLPEVANYQEPWTTVEARLHQLCQDLTSIDGAVVFLCTVFRHVPSDDTRAQSRLLRIRRLNLLAAELSRKTGLLVIDLDRSLADIGASKLQADYRLAGQYASEAAAKFIALAVISAGLDNYLSFEIQDAAKAMVVGSQLRLAEPAIAKRDIVLPNVLKLGTGRRKQTVASVVDTNKDNHAGWLLHLLMTGQFGIRDAFTKLRQSVARRGFRSSVAMVLAAVRQALRSHASLGR
jgi:hypothetical protein